MSAANNASSLTFAVRALNVVGVWLAVPAHRVWMLNLRHRHSEAHRHPGWGEHATWKSGSSRL